VQKVGSRLHAAFVADDAEQLPCEALSPLFVAAEGYSNACCLLIPSSGPLPSPFVLLLFLQCASGPYSVVPADVAPEVAFVVAIAADESPRTRHAAAVVAAAQVRQLKAHLAPHLAQCPIPQSCPSKYSPIPEHPHQFLLTRLVAAVAARNKYFRGCDRGVALAHQSGWMLSFAKWWIGLFAVENERVMMASL